MGVQEQTGRPEVGSLTTKASELSISGIELEKRAATNAGSLSGKIKEVPELFTFKEHERPTVAHDDYSELEIPVIDLTGDLHSFEQHVSADKSYRRCTA